MLRVNHLPIFSTRIIKPCFFFILIIILFYIARKIKTKILFIFYFLSIVVREAILIHEAAHVAARVLGIAAEAAPTPVVLGRQAVPRIVRVVALHPATRVVPDPFPATLAVPDLLPDPSQNQYHVDRCQTGVNREIALEIDRVHVIGPTIDHARSLDRAADRLGGVLALAPTATIDKYRRYANFGQQTIIFFSLFPLLFSNFFFFFFLFFFFFNIILIVLCHVFLGYL